MQFADLSSPAFFENPYPLYDELRKQGPLLPIAPNIFLTGQYAVIEALLADRRMGKTYMQSVIARYGETAPNQAVFKTLSRMFLMMNPPGHTRLRTLLMKAFNARQIDKFKETAEAIANGLIDRLCEKASFDLIDDYALPLPVHIICQMLDIPIEDGLSLSGHASLLVQAFDAAPLDAERLAASNAAAEALEAYFEGVVRHRRMSLSDDLISALIAAEADGEHLNEAEIVSNVLLLFVAGHETTSNMLGNALISLHRHPAQLERLRRDPSLVSNAVNECLRFDTSVQMVVRTSFDDIDVADVRLPRGSMVFMMLGAANRDPRHFDDPDTFDITRSAATRSLAFGGGIHFCLGSRLATLEISVALTALLHRLPALRLLNMDALQWRQRNNLRGVSRLLAENKLSAHA